MGPGAHGRLNGTAVATEKYPETWAKMVEAQGHGLVEQQALTKPEQAPEYLIMGMRIAEGIDLERHAALAGRAISSEKIAALAALDLVQEDGKTLRATPRGRPLLNAIIRELNG